MKILSTEISDQFNYKHYIFYKQDKECELYYKKKSKALIELVNYVMQNELTSKQRDAVILVKIKGLKSNEAADILGIDASTISRHLKGAQRKFDRAYEYFECVKSILTEDD